MSPASRKWMVCKSDPEFDRRGAELFYEIYRRSVNRDGHFSVVLSGGNTPLGVYSTLANPEWRSRIDWNKVDLFWGDERFVSPDDPQSNYGSVRARLLNHLPIPGESVHPIPTQNGSPEESASQYEKAIRTFFDSGVRREPRFHLILLGMGDDGHTASLFPGCFGPDEKTRWVVATYVNRLASWRITMTIPLINQAETIMVMAKGKKKGEILSRIQDPALSEPYPVARIRPLKGELLFLIDEEVASCLRETQKH